MLPVPDTTAALRAWRDATLYRLLLRGSQAERQETLHRLRQRGYADVTHADTALLASLDTNDTTITGLARGAAPPGRPPASSWRSWNARATSAANPTPATAEPSWSGARPGDMPYSTTHWR
jgi:hypothetical protein